MFKISTLLNCTEPPSSISPTFYETPEFDSIISTFGSYLSSSVKKRVDTIPSSQTRLAILFSGGLDCTSLAILAHKHLPQNESIDLINVAFENPRIMKARKGENPYEICPDRGTGRKGWLELSAVFPEREWRFIQVNVPYQEYCEHQERITELSMPSATVMDLSIASAFWFASRGKGNILLFLTCKFTLLRANGIKQDS